MSADGAPARFALLLHGKIGRLNTTASQAVRDHTGASRELITLCSRTHLHFIVAANSGSAGGVDVTGHHSNPTDHQQIDRMTPRHPSRVHCQVFVHTWNPDSGAFIDASYGPHLRASKHQPVEQRNTNVGNKVAQTSATCLFEGSFLRQLMPQPGPNQPL
jgi:hypothetical protein